MRYTRKSFRKFRTLCTVILLGLLCLTGCGQKPEGEPLSGENTLPSGSAENFSIDWKTDGFPVSKEVQENQSLWVEQYIPLEHEINRHVEEEEQLYKVCGPQTVDGCIYQFFSVYSGGSMDKYLLEIYDTSVMQSAVTEFAKEKLGMTGGYITDMTVTEHGKYAFLIQQYEDLNLIRGEIIFSDLESEPEKVDLMPAICEKGLTDIWPRCFCDAQGNIYLQGLSEAQPTGDLLVIDRTGSLRAQYLLEESDQLCTPFFTPDGELIFPVNNSVERTARLVRFDLSRENANTLAKLENESFIQVYGFQANALYYNSYEGIVKWDLVSGNRALAFSFQDNSVSLADYNTALALRDGQMPVFRMCAQSDGSKDWLAVLVGQEPERPDALQIVNLCGDSSRVKNCMALASRRNPNFAFACKSCAPAETEDFRTRILADLTAGSGPDILYVSCGDMQRLQEMGVLADLDDFLSEEEKERILPGVIELGTADGVFVGIAPGIDRISVVTLSDIWEQDTWSLSDLIGLLDTGNFTGIFCQGTTGFAPQAQLKWLTEFGLQESSLIDWETRESHFDSDLFVKILELAKTYGVDDPMNADTYLGIGGCVGMISSLSIQANKELYEMFGNEYHYVGMPTRRSSGSYLNSKGVLVVNKAAANPEAVSAYLSCLLEDEIQYPIGGFDSEYSILRVSPEDGSTILPDYAKALDSCTPQPATYNYIKDMVWEECQSYFSGDKSAKAVAQILDSRIQLYLDEGN